MVKEQKERITGEPMCGDVSYVEVNVAKNRNGQTGNAYLFFYKSFGRFVLMNQVKNGSNK